MPLELPAADKTTLANAPLELVVCQLKFDETVAISDSRTILKVHEGLGGRSGTFPKVQETQVQVTELPIGPAGLAGLPTTKTQKGWQLASEDGAWIATLVPDSLALQATRYSSWEEDFGPRLYALIDAVAGAAGLSMEQRLGVRYVDRITRPEVNTPVDWKHWIVSEMLGAILHPTLGVGVRAAMQQIELDVADGVRCTLRQGTLPDPSRHGAYQYILDTDVFRDGLRRFDVDDVKHAATQFHDAAVRIFQQIVTSDLRLELGGTK